MNRSNVMKRLLNARRRLSLAATVTTVPSIFEVWKYSVRKIAEKIGKNDRIQEHEMEFNDEII